MNASELFACRRCGDCCRGFGGTYVTDADIQAIGELLELTPAQVRRRYCQRSGRRLVLAQGPDGYCVFWDELCRIHPVKPRMCKAWPFIGSVITDVANWHAMASMCPGMRTDVADADILRIVAIELDPSTGGS